jgi:hypothetical protein
MGGTIDVMSGPGEGSPFWLFVPFAEASAPDPEVAPALNGQPTCAKVRPAEDLPMNQIVISEMMLLRAGHEITFVENGAAVVREVERAVYDIVLMDQDAAVRARAVVEARYYDG